MSSDELDEKSSARERLAFVLALQLVIIYWQPSSSVTSFFEQTNAHVLSTIASPGCAHYSCADFVFLLAHAIKVDGASRACYTVRLSFFSFDPGTSRVRTWAAMHSTRTVKLLLS